MPKKGKFTRFFAPKTNTSHTNQVFHRKTNKQHPETLFASTHLPELWQQFSFTHVISTQLCVSLSKMASICWVVYFHFLSFKRSPSSLLGKTNTNPLSLHDHLSAAAKVHKESRRLRRRKRNKRGKKRAFVR